MRDVEKLETGVNGKGLPVSVNTVVMTRIVLASLLCSVSYVIVNMTRHRHWREDRGDVAFVDCRNNNTFPSCVCDKNQDPVFCRAKTQR